MSRGTRITRRAALGAVVGAGAAGVLGCTPAAPSDPVSMPAGTASAVPTSPPPSGGTTPSPGPRARATTKGSGTGVLARPGPDLVRGPASRRVVALTFHAAGPVELAREVLHVLAADHAVATVFAVGQWLEAHHDVGRAVVAASHDLGNHTWSHQVMPRLGAHEARREVQRGADAVAAVLGRPGLLFRPSGTPRSTPLIRSAARAAGYARCVSYDVDSLDYLDPGARAVRSLVLKEVRPGSVVSLHLGHPGTVTALPGLLAGLRDRGLAPVTITQMFGGG